MAPDLIMDSAPPETEPQWLFNRRINIEESRLYSLPDHVLLNIMELLAINDRVGIYMIRQVCQRFAELFSASRFRGFHETDDSIILGREMRNVPLETLPLKVFRERFIYVGFAPYTWMARRALMRDFKKKAIRAAESSNTDKAGVSVEKKKNPICDYCSRRHPAEDFRSSELRLGDDYVRTCERWYGHQNVCGHCDIGKLKMGDEGLGEPKPGIYDRGIDDKWDHWSCKECFGKDLTGTQDNIFIRFPETVSPCFEMSVEMQIDLHAESYYLRWCMPLFANMNNKPDPKDITRSLVRKRLQELSEGPYEDLLRLAVGPMASFRDELFLEPFGEDGIQDPDWGKYGKVIHTLEREDGWSVHEDDDGAPLDWFMKNGDLYLRFEHHNWSWCEPYYHSRDGTHADELYWELNPEDEEEDNEY